MKKLLATHVRRCRSTEFEEEVNVSLFDILEIGGEIIDIKYSTCANDDDIFYTCLIIYSVEEGIPSND